MNKKIFNQKYFGKVLSLGFLFAVVFVFSNFLRVEAVEKEIYTETKTGTVTDSFTQSLGDEVITSDNYTIYPSQTNQYGSDGTYFWQGGAAASDYAVVQRSSFKNTFLTCNAQNIYNYKFQYFLKKFDEKASDSFVNKCDEIRTTLSPIGDWGATFNKDLRVTRAEDILLYYGPPHSPPTDVLSCVDEADCLSKATEYQINPELAGKGVQKITPTFTSETANSLTGGDVSLICKNGVCAPYASGNHSLNSVTPQSSFYSQCKTNGLLMNLPGVVIPQVSSTLNFNVVNRAPLVSLSLDKNKISVGDEVTATCDIIDPDTCSDKIVRVEWTCLNAQKEKVDCYFSKNGIWKEGRTNIDVPETEQKNQYRSIVKWKAGKEGAFAVICEGIDNDEESSATGKSVAGIVVGPEQCGSDGICNLNCPYDPDCCGDSSYAKNHADKCVVAAGSCIVTRTKPSLNVSLIEPFDPATFQANVLGGFNPTGYTWYCDKNDNNISSENKSNFNSDEQTCNKYSERGKTYEPKVMYNYKDENGNNQSKECTNSQGIAVKVNGQLGVDSCSCVVLVRPDGSDDEYSSNTKVNVGDKVDAKLTKKCTKTDATIWTTDGTKVGTSTNTKTLIQFNQVGTGTGYIKASIGGTQCKEASVNINEQVNWGNN